MRLRVAALSAMPLLLSGQQGAPPVVGGRCNAACVCAARGGAPIWDFSALAGTRRVSGAGGEHEFDLCGNVSPVPPVCLTMTPAVTDAQVVRLSGGFCNQVGPDFALEDPGDDLDIVAPFFGGARFIFAYTSQASGRRRSLTVNLVCDHGADASSGPGSTRETGEELGDDVQLEWGTAAVCGLAWGFPFLMALGLTSLLYVGIGMWWGRRSRRERCQDIGSSQCSRQRSHPRAGG